MTRPTMRMMLTGIFAAGVVLPLAAEPAHRWVPIDRITMGVTGDLTVDGNTLTFGNGAALTIKLVASHKRGHWSDLNQIEEADVYRIDPPANPKLPRDNVLCSHPVTYIVLSYPVPHEAYLLAYSGPNPPRGDGAEMACSTFSYTEG